MQLQTRSRNYIIASAVLALLILGVIRVHLIYKWQLAPILLAHRSIQDKELASYKKDVIDLDANFPFKQVFRGHADAGVELNEQIAWLPRAITPPRESSRILEKKSSVQSHNLKTDSTPNPHDQGEAKQKKIALPVAPLDALPVAPPVALPITLPDDLRSDLIRYGNLYLEHPSHFSNYHLNLSFFSTLKRFDYWDIESHSPISELIAQHKFVPPNDLPIPDPLDLISIAKLRLLSAGQETSVQTGLQEVRELARLLLTTENSQLVTAGLSILEAERYATQFYVKKAILKREDWRPVSENLLLEARRAFDGTEGYLHLWTKDSTLDDLFIKHEFPVGLCAALNNQMPVVESLRSYLEPQLPFEIDYRNEYKRFNEIMARAQKNCRLRYLTELTRTNNFPAVLPGLALMNGAPYWRKLFALRASLANYSTFESYEKLTAVSHQLYDSAPTERIPADD